MEPILMKVVEYALSNWIEVLGMLSGLAGVWLMTRENIWAWPVSLVSVCAYTVVFWEAFLFGDFLLHLYYIGMSLYGWYHWLYGGKQAEPLPLSVGKPREWWLLGGLGTLFTGAMGLLFSTYPQASVPYWDAGTTSFSLIGQWQQAQKRVENWITWIAVDIVASGIYFYKAFYLTAGLYLIYTLLAIHGFRQWKANMG